MPHYNELTKLNILVCIVSNTALTDISNHVRQFYSRFNNVLFVIGKGSREMCTLPLNKVYCLPSLTYGCETWTLNDQSINIFSPDFGGKV